MLEPEQEYILAKNWREKGDRESAHTLVTSHLRLVAKIAMGYRGYGLPVGELISEGNIGLMQAVKKFDPERGFRLATYAMWWIKAAIQEYILRSWSLVKIGTTAAQKKLFFNLRKLKNQIFAIESGDMTNAHVKEIANRLDVNEDEVISMNRRMAGQEQSLNAIMKHDKSSVKMTEFIKNGERLSIDEASVCDFALFSWLGDNNKCVNKKIMYDINEPLTVSECSDIKFMLVEMRIRENNVYKVDLKTDDYNFYLVGNKLTRQFFIWCI